VLAVESTGAWFKAPKVHPMAERNQVLELPWRKGAAKKLHLDDGPSSPERTLMHARHRGEGRSWGGKLVRIRLKKEEEPDRSVDETRTRGRSSLGLKVNDRSNESRRTGRIESQNLSAN